MGLFDLESRRREYNIAIQPVKNGYVVANVRQDSNGDFENISVAENEEACLKLVKQYLNVSLTESYEYRYLCTPKR